MSLVLRSLVRRKSLLQPNSFPFPTQCRNLFIQTITTPNANSLKFIPSGKEVLPATYGATSLDFPDYRTAQKSPLAQALFQIEGVSGVLLAQDFLSVNVTDGTEWSIVKPQVYAAIMDFFSANKTVVKEDVDEENVDTSQSDAESSTTIREGDSDVVAMIKELLETRVRPAVMEDGGDIVFKSFDPDTGLVKVLMQGSCKGCSSSTVTLKNGIENMLMHYVPEVTAVEEWVDKVLETVSESELKKLEERLAKERGSSA